MFRTRLRAFAVTAAAAVALTSLAACAEDPPADDAADTLVIGVSGTEPGLSWVGPDGSFSGFDVDLATYVAGGLGWNDRDVTFRLVTPQDRERALGTGEVDLVVGTYAMTAQHEEAVDFAGPYLVAGQDLLVRRSSDITGAGALADTTVCGTTGATGTAELARVAQHSPRVTVRRATDTAACVDLLVAGEVDAVTADDAVLAGYAAQRPRRVRVVGSPLTRTYYGIGLPQGSPDVGRVNDILAAAITDGTWEDSMRRHLGRSGYVAPMPPTPGAAVPAT